MEKLKKSTPARMIACLIAAALAFGAQWPVVSFAEDAPTAQASQSASSAVAGTASSTDEGLKAEMPRPGNVTVNFKDVDILTVLNYISEVSGIDIIPSPGVDAKVTMRLRDKPWETALDIVTRNYGYVYSREGDVIRVIPKGQVNTEETITEVISLNNLIREIELTKQVKAGAAGGGASGSEVTVQAKQESIQQLMSAINSILDSKRGEKATFVAGVNSIIVTAVPSKISEIKKMVNKIDRRTAQIILDTKVIEIRLNDDERFGVNWNAIVSAAGARKAITFPFTNSGALSFLPSQQRYYYPQSTDITGALLPGQNGFPYVGLDNTIDATAQTLATNSANLFSFGTLDFSTFTATLSLLENRGDTEILSSPRITTLDNQKATIKVVDKVMLQKTQETTMTAAVVTVEFESEADAREAGVKLTVIPHVNEKNEISINLLPEVSTNQGFTAIPISPTVSTVALTFNSREANTIVRCTDGETIFMGGLIRKNTVKTNNKLPILGDLFGGVPWLGSAFKYEADNTTRTEIVFFVTVHLVKDGMDSINASQSNDRYTEYITNAKPMVPLPKGMRKDNCPAQQSAPKTPVVQTGEIIDVQKEVPIANVQTQPAEKPKKKAFLDFSKK